MALIALYGYGHYGRRAAESFSRFWGNEHTVTAIFDEKRSGETDPFWNLTVLDPEYITGEFRRGTFASVLVCIHETHAYDAVSARLRSLNIPEFFPGSEEAFGGPECFLQDEHPGITVSRKHYDFHVYKNMLGAVPDFNREAMLFLFNEEGRVNIGSHRKYYAHLLPKLLSWPFRFRDPLPERVFMEGSWCVISKTYPSNYWHFTIESADCVYLMEKAGYTGKYLYSERQFSNELLEIMGISKDRLVSLKELDVHKVYEFERLYDINHYDLKPMESSEDVLSEMGSEIRRKLRKDDSLPKKLCIRRIGIRKLLNLEETAVRNGFTVMIPENHTLKEQMELFCNADIILSPHGANSTNCMYMHPGSVFVEFYSNMWELNVNARVCQASGIHFLRMVGTVTDTDAVSGMYADYTVDEDQLQALITEAESLLGS